MSAYYGLADYGLTDYNVVPASPIAGSGGITVWYDLYRAALVTALSVQSDKMRRNRPMGWSAAATGSIPAHHGVSRAMRTLHSLTPHPLVKLGSPDTVRGGR